MNEPHDAVPFFQSFSGVMLSLITVLVSYSLFKLYKSTVIPEELASLPRVSILASLKALLFTKGGFINETEVMTQSASEWCVQHGKDKDAWKEMYLVWLFGNWGVVLGKPEYIRTLFTNTETFPKFLYKDVGFFLNDKFLGTNVILSNGDVWKRHRKMVNPAFHRSWAATLFGEMGRTLISQWDALEKKKVDICDWMQRLTLDILSSAAFGQNLDYMRQPSSEIVKLYNSIVKDLQLPIFMLIPILQKMTFLPFVKDLNQRIDKFHAFIDSVIEAKEKEVRQRLENGDSKEEGERDLLEMMLETSFKDPTITRKDLRSNIVVFFLAGHDTTTSALSVALLFLGLKKDIQDKAREEVIKIMGDIEPNTPFDKIPYPTSMEQAQMDYLTFIIKESLRLYPPVSGLPLRRPSKPVTMGSIPLPVGTPLHVDIFGVQRDPAMWGKDAHVFRPERWAESGTGGVQLKSVLPSSSSSTSGLGESSAVTSLASGQIPMMPSAHGFTWIPFGGGSRLCLGQQFSLIEQRVILAMILLRYEWKVVGDENALKGHPLTASGVLLHPKEVYVEFRKRRCS